MRIGGSSSTPYQVYSASAASASQLQGERADAQHKVKVLKAALESQKGAADQLLQMLDPKGARLDIRA